MFNIIVSYKLVVSFFGGIMNTNLEEVEVQALLIMFEKIWQKKFSMLDGQNGRPSISECVEMVLHQENNKKPQEDLIDFLENHLEKMSNRL